jgi:hypothetical protein
MNGSNIDVPDLLVCPTTYWRDKNDLIAIVKRCFSGYIAMIYSAGRSFHDVLQARITDKE